MSVLILALVLVNLVFTAILTFSIVPATQNANKLIEEVNELAEASDEIDSEYISELCDVHDILNEIDSISIDNAEDARKLHAVRRDKVGKRGKFENYIFLESVEYENK